MSKRFWRSTAVAVCLLLTGGSARAQKELYTTNALLEHCRNSLVEGARFPRPFEAGFCMGLVAGASYTDPKSCAPEAATINQLTRVVLAYIELRPQRLNEPFMKLVVEALRNEWPC